MRIPKHARKELEAYLDCGLLCRGFARLKCEECGESQVVAFSCYLQLQTIRSQGRRSLDSQALARAPLRIVSRQRAK